MFRREKEEKVHISLREHVSIVWTEGGKPVRKDRGKGSFPRIIPFSG
jgi:hypothetical protein